MKATEKRVRAKYRAADNLTLEILCEKGVPLSEAIKIMDGKCRFTVDGAFTTYLGFRSRWYFTYYSKRIEP